MTAEFRRFTHANVCIYELIKFSLTFFFLSSLQHLDIVSPFQLYFNPTLIVLHYQLWRLVTTFLFFGTIGFNFLFNMTFTYRYCRMLEEGSFRGKSSDFIMMFIFGGALMIVSKWWRYWIAADKTTFLLIFFRMYFFCRYLHFSLICCFWGKHSR